MPTKKQLEEQIKKLKEKDKMRVDEIDKTNDYSLLVKSDCDFWEQKSNNLKEEIEKLEEENEKLKEEIANIATIKNKQIKKEKDKYESMCSEQAKSDCSKYIKELQEENEKLKEESEKLAAERNKLEEVMIYEHTSCYDGRMMLVKTLWEKEEDWRDRIDLDFSYINEEIIKLKEENEKLKEECGAMNIVEKLNKEFDEVQTQNQNLKEEKEFWEKQYWDLMTEFKFMVCFHQYNNIPNGEGGDVNDLNSPLGKLLYDLPHTSFWKDDFHDEFNEFIDNLVKNTEHKRD